ncbi:hypothetical protein A4X13_0g5693, partial [Tilletia indica]
MKRKAENNADFNSKKKARNGSKNKYKNAPGQSLPLPRPHVNHELTAARAALPVAAGKDAIIASLRQHDTIIVLGETGSGKTTQIPQFLFEAGFADDELPPPRTGAGSSANGSGSKVLQQQQQKRNTRPKIIAVTQPRRVAATSLASRIAAEMGCPDPAKQPLRSHAMAAKANAKARQAQQNKAPALVGYSI